MREPGHRTFDTGSVEFAENDGILIVIPDTQELEYQALMLKFPVVDRSKIAQEFVQGAKRGVMADGKAELLTNLADGVTRLSNSESWQASLTVQRRFHCYSWANAVL